MFYTFSQIPTILDNTVVSQLPNPEKITQQESDFLNNLDHSRNMFKQILNPQKLQMMTNGSYTVLEHLKELEEYLKMNVEMMRILVLKSINHPQFQYGLFISSKQKSYDTKVNSIEEACGCEIVMVRYMFSSAFNLSAYPLVNKIQNAILQNFSLHNTTLQNHTSQDITNALKLMEIVLRPIHRLCNCMEDLLKSLVTHQKTLIPELRMTVIVSYKNILDSNANFIFLEQLRQQKDYDKMAKVCRTTYSKLNESYQRFSQLSEEVDNSLINFCHDGMVFYKTYACWCILQVNEKNIKIENFKQKNYIILTSENSKLALEILRVSNQLKEIHQRSQFQDFMLAFIQGCLIPTLEKILALYQLNANINVKNPEELFMGLDSSLDFYETINK